MDLKTSSSSRLPSQADTAKNPQLSAYQLALSKGKLVGGEKAGAGHAANGAHQVRVITGDGMEIGLAMLLYPLGRTNTAGTREQARLDEEQLREFHAQLELHLLFVAFGVPGASRRGCDHQCLMSFSRI